MRFFDSDDKAYYYELYADHERCRQKNLLHPPIIDDREDFERWWNRLERDERKIVLMLWLKTRSNIADLF